MVLDVFASIAMLEGFIAVALIDLPLLLELLFILLNGMCTGFQWSQPDFYAVFFSRVSQHKLVRIWSQELCDEMGTYRWNRIGNSETGA